jgi:predicted nuclease of predicted toxin-antitoxin system
MRLKLDENLGERGRVLFATAGHDTSTVAEQKLSGAEDQQVIEVCRSEDRVLVTLDLDFSNPMRFPPQLYSGVAVLRLPARITPADLTSTCETLIRGLSRQPIAGKLWIVQRDRIREYQPPQDPAMTADDQN